MQRDEDIFDESEDYDSTDLEDDYISRYGEKEEESIIDKYSDFDNGDFDPEYEE